MSLSKPACSSISLKEVSKSGLGLRANSDSNLEEICSKNLKGNGRKTSMTLRSEKKDSDDPSQHDCADAERVEIGGPTEIKTPEFHKRHPGIDEQPGQDSDMEEENGPSASFYIGTRSGVHDKSDPDGNHESKLSSSSSSEDDEEEDLIEERMNLERCLAEVKQQLLLKTREIENEIKTNEREQRKRAEREEIEKIKREITTVREQDQGLDRKRNVSAVKTTPSPTISPTLKSIL